MKLDSTFFLRFVIILIGVVVLGLCIFVLPAGIMAKNAGGYRPILLGMYIPAIPFYIGLFQAMKLLNYIDKNKAYSALSVAALKKIKYCGFIISALYAAGMPYIFTVADRDDAPGVVLIALIFVIGSFVIGTAAAVFQNLFQNAIDIKSENELTV
jgi:hypothetical protein